MGTFVDAKGTPRVGATVATTGACVAACVGADVTTGA